MPKLDRFLSALTEYRAEALVLEQDQAPAFRFLSGTKTVSKQVLSVDKVLGLLKELVPPQALEEFRRDGTSSFLYQLGETAYSGIIEQDAGKVVATLWEAAQTVAEEQGTPLSAPTSSEPIAAPAVPVTGIAPTATPAPAAAPRAAAPPAGGISLPSLDEMGADDLIPDDLPPNYRADMEKLLRGMIDRGASDLHLCCGNHPGLRIDGQVQYDDTWPELHAEELYRMLFSITPKRNRDEFIKTHDTDFAYAIEGLSRYRCNLFFDRKGPGAVFRAIPNEIIPAEKLGLPPLVHELALMNKGLVLVTGPTGSGKSTTLAAILDIVNQKRNDHILTIEDPIEFVHPNKGCLVNQREVGVHTNSFKTALRAALREDPDIILVGELRDLETVAIAIETAETGHLVFGTLHTTTAASTVDRIIDQFPPDQQAQIRVMLSESLQCVISQTLCKKKGGGRVAALEVLLGVPAISNLIREGKTFQIEGTMQTQRKAGMQTLNDHLMKLVKDGLVEPREAYLKSVQKDALRDMFGRNGISLD